MKTGDTASRLILLNNWLERQLSPDVAKHDFKLTPASSDASFRRYFRITLPNAETRIVMDAPPEREDCRPFIRTAALFREAGVHVPVIHVMNLEHGFLLLSDLGDKTYLEALDISTAPELYRDAAAALIAIQRASCPDVLPDYDRTLLRREMDMFPEWYVARHLGVAMSPQQNSDFHSVSEKILDNALAQPKVFVHRDYHSRNLMATSHDNPGILDFQDAVYGPITYDIVSLFRDAYIDWEEELELDFVIRYWEAARDAKLPVPPDFYDFYRDYEWMGAQRQLKVIGIFSRLCHRDGKDGYLKDLPRVMAYLRRVCARYTELRPLARLLNQFEKVQPRTCLTF
ncbi:MAG: phosphotransferase [Candidatus Accumulibacter sp.]|jgi:aminoglycoside/choline kinase family phosphotransferase|nr:phosphotransferase [Accumulibacter sp.]